MIYMLLSGPVNPPKDVLIVDEKHKLVYCKIPQVGSTMFLRLLAEALLPAVQGKKQHPAIHSSKFLNSIGLKFRHQYTGKILKH